MEEDNLRILVPLDGSVIAETALTWARSIAGTTGTEVLLVRVALPLRASLLMAPVMGDSTGAAESEHELSREYLEKVSVQLREAGIVTSVEVESSKELDEGVKEYRARLAARIADVIIDLANQEDIDLVVMASHGMTGNLDLR